MKKILILLAISCMTLMPSFAATIYVLHDGHGSSVNAVSLLTSLGYTVTVGGVLTNYGSYNQVWDLRYNSALTSAENTAYKTYLEQGGRLYLSGEHSGFDHRNTTLVSFVSLVNGGTLSLSADYATTQTVVDSRFTANGLSSISINSGRSTTSAGTGFFVTKDTAAGKGSILGWDAGSLSGSPSGKMLIGFDIDMFSNANASAMVRNFSDFLGSAVTPVPEPQTLVLCLLAVAALLGKRYTA